MRGADGNSLHEPRNWTADAPRPQRLEHEQRLRNFRPVVRWLAAADGDRPRSALGGYQQVWDAPSVVLDQKGQAYSAGLPGKTWPGLTVRRHRDD